MNVKNSLNKRGSAVNVIFRKDFLEMIRDGRVFIALGLIIVLAIAAFWLSAEKIKSYESARNIADNHDRRTWVNQGSVGAHSAAHFSSWAFKPQTALSIVDPGLSPYYGDAIWMEAHKQNLPIHRTAEDSSEISRFADLSPAWLTAIFLPIILIALGFSSLARERESGQWKQMMASGVLASNVLHGKAKLLLIIGLTIAVAFTLPAIIISYGLINPADAVTRWILILIAAILYAIALVGVTLAISAISKTSRGALLALVGFWMLCIICAPRFIGSVIEIVVPTPSSQIFFAKIAEDLDENCAGGHDLAGKNVKKFEEEILKKYGVTSKEDLPVDLAGFTLQACEEYGNRVFDSYYGELKAVHERQQLLLRIGSIVSPVIAFRNATAAFSGGDVEHHWDFVKAAEDHRRKIIRKLNLEMIEKGGLKGYDYELDSKSLNEIPQFLYKIPAWTISKWALFDLVILLLWGVVSISIALFAVQRWRSI